MRWAQWVALVRSQDDGLPAELRHARLVLATYADEEGRCWPSLATLAHDMGVSLQAARQRVRRLIAAGLLVKESGGRWKGDPTHYRLLPKGIVHDTLSKSQRVSPTPSKGIVHDPQRVSPTTPERIRTFKNGAGTALSSARPARQEGVPAMAPMPTVVPVATGTVQGKRNERRALAQAIRSAKADSIRRRFLATFEKRYSMYPESSRRHNVRPIHPSVMSIVRGEEVAA